MCLCICLCMYSHCQFPPDKHQQKHICGWTNWVLQLIVQGDNTHPINPGGISITGCCKWLRSLSLRCNSGNSLRKWDFGLNQIYQSGKNSMIGFIINLMWNDGRLGTGERNFSRGTSIQTSHDRAIFVV